MPDIYSKINSIMADMPAISKDKTNEAPGSKYKYRGIDDVMNALNPLLVKHGVFMAPEVLTRHREERASKSGGVLAFTVLTVKYTFYAASDGSSISVVVTGEGMDSSDKSTNKALAGAMKYALFQLFCIPTEDMIDGDRETPESPAPKNQPTSQQKRVAPDQDKKSLSQKVQELDKQAQEEVRLLKQRKDDLHKLAEKYGIADTGINSLMKDMKADGLIRIRKLFEYDVDEYHDMYTCLEQKLQELGYPMEDDVP